MALQHVPLFPPGSRACPYNYENAEETIAAVREGGISLVLAGHYHKGFDPVTKDGVTYIAAAAFCESPFAFLEVRLEAGREPEVIRHELRMPEGLPLAESHVHTELAYCAEHDLTAADAADTARLCGVEDMAFAEHSGQLYFDRDTFWGARFMSDGLQTREGREDRMADYRARTTALGLPRSRIGFEVDFDFQGRMVLEPAHRKEAGFLIGSYHWTPESAAREPFQAVRCIERLRTIWGPMLASGIDVLAHPFRFFARQPDDPPPEIFRELAALLAASGVAAELNTHIELPYPQFVLACLEAGVRFSLGTDSHNLAEVAEFWPHLQLLRSLGVRDSEWDGILWRPGLPVRGGGHPPVRPSSIPRSTKYR
ncbi:MAG: hypothetical protein U1E27_09130 [Kiritimatiellia bacterium]|nr:hypothetical protein [Kiritimatiellia bacterium]